MIILDHNIPQDQAQSLRRRRLHVRQIGFEVGRPEWDDQQEILRYLHRTKQVTFFTRDLGFYRARLRHGNYCLVALTVPLLETADYIFKILHHGNFNTRAKRNGKVIKVSTKNIIYWQIGLPRPSITRWWTPILPLKCCCLNSQWQFSNHAHVRFSLLASGSPNHPIGSHKTLGTTLIILNFR